MAGGTYRGSRCSHPLPPFLAGTPGSWRPCCGNGLLWGGGGLVKSWLLAVPGLASLLSDCVQSNLTSEWAEPTLNPPPQPQTWLNPLGTRSPGHGLECGFFLPSTYFFRPQSRAGNTLGIQVPGRIPGISGHCCLILLEKYNYWSFLGCFVLSTGAPSCVALGGPSAHLRVFFSCRV